MVQHVMPTIPWVVFAIFEPLFLISGFLTIIGDPHEYLRALGPTPESYTPNAASVAAIFSLGNLCLLVAGAQFICCHVSREPRVARAFIFIITFADYGHIWSTYLGVGYDGFIDFRSWNPITTANIGVSVVLNILRILYLAGVFGEDGYNGLKENEVSKKSA